MDLIQSSKALYTILLDKDLYFKSANQFFLNKTKHDLSLLKTRSFEEFIHSDSLDLWNQVKVEILFFMKEKKSSIDILNKFYKKLTLRYFDITSNIDLWIDWEIFNSNHEDQLENSQCISFIGIDITAQIRMETYLNKILQENRAILSTLPDLILVIDKELRYVNYHTNHPELLISDPAELMNKKVGDILGVEMENLTKKMIQDYNITNKTSISEYSLFINNIECFFEARCYATYEENYMFLIRDITESHLKKVSMLKDLEMAKDLQLSMLPDLKKYINRPFSIDCFYKPLSQVSGDFYDIIELGVNKIRFVLIDAVGHGIQASLQTMAIQSELSRYLNINEKPSEIIKTLNERIISKYNNSYINFTCSLMDIDFSKKSIDYSSAGHPKQIFISEGQIKIIENHGPVIGYFPEAEFTNESFHWKENFDLFLFTDGLFEFFMDDKNMYDETMISSELLKCLIEFPHSAQNLSKNKFLEWSIEQIKTKSIYNEFMDDVILLHIQV